MRGDEKMAEIARRMNEEFVKEGLEGYGILIFHESDTIMDLLKLNSDAILTSFPEKVMIKPAGKAKGTRRKVKELCDIG